MKKFYLAICLLTIVTIFSGCSLSQSNNNKVEAPDPAFNSDEKAVLYFFWGDGCSYCEKQKPFLTEMKSRYPDLVIKEYETWKNKDNADLFQRMAAAYKIKARGVPATFIGDGEPFIGFSDSMKAGMESRIKTCLEQGCVDPGSKL